MRSELSNGVNTNLIFGEIQNAKGLAYVIQRAFYIFKALCTHVCVAQGGINVVVAQQFLNKPNIGATLKQVCGKTVPQPVDANVFIDLRFF